MNSAKGPRAAGTDGSDYKHRMLVKDRYKQMAESRRQFLILQRYHIVHAISAVLFYGYSHYFGSPKTNVQPLVLLVSHVLAFFYYIYTAGTVKKNDVKVLKTYFKFAGIYSLFALYSGFISYYVVDVNPSGRAWWLDAVISWWGFLVFVYDAFLGQMLYSATTAKNE
eukprot:Colp12_sorted_trinity150504_noHs@30232